MADTTVSRSAAADTTRMAPARLAPEPDHALHPLAVGQVQVEQEHVDGREFGRLEVADRGEGADRDRPSPSSTVWDSPWGSRGWSSAMATPIIRAPAIRRRPLAGR